MFIANICIFIANIDFLGKFAFESEVVIFGKSYFFRTSRLGLISAKPYYQNARVDRGMILGVRRNLAIDCKLPVRSGFLGVSLISALFVSY